jgi:hypothetical protein
VATYPREELEDAASRLIAAHAEATRRNEWTWLVDQFYTADCVYLCEYAGTMRVEARGRDQIKATHYGRDMLVGWEGWSFPYAGFAVKDDRITTNWYNRGPGSRPDGSPYQTPGISIITYAGNGQFSSQLDLFDLAHQMHLCDELEAAGLLSPRLKAEWVIPTKRRLIEMLSRNLPTA